MAGIEQLTVHSKSYIVRWIRVDAHNSISWSVQPQKKSINFGIVKHPGTKNGLTPVLPSSDTVEPLSGTAVEELAANRKSGRNSVSRHDSSQAMEKLQSIGIKSVAWAGRCEAEKVSVGRYDVPEGEGGMYGMVLDNTFSKQVSKTVNFVLLTHPTNAPPKSGHHLHYSQAFSGSTTSIAKGGSPTLPPLSDSSESLPQDAAMHRAILEDPRPRSRHGQGVESKGIEGTSFYTGVLHKKRRRKAQGWAKRFFSLDFTSSTLSYYRNRHSSALRGAVPLSLAAVGVDEKTREFSVDSGAEVWHLRAGNSKDFDGWRDALERASAIATAASAPGTPGQPLSEFTRSTPINPAEEREWERIEQLVSRVSGSRDAARRLAKDTDPKYGSISSAAGLGLMQSHESSGQASPASHSSSSNYFPDVDDKPGERRSFWKRKPSSTNERNTAALFRRSVSAQLAVPSPGALSGTNPPSPGNLTVPKSRGPTPVTTPVPAGPLPLEDDVHERCMQLLLDLDHVVVDFSALIAESKARRIPPVVRTNSRLSLDSIRSEEFFDAEDGQGPMSPSQVFNIRRSSEFDDIRGKDPGDDMDANSDASSDAGDSADDPAFAATPKADSPAMFSNLPEKLPPLPLPGVKRRDTIQPPKQPPPSIIGFLRKNAGKDLSTVSMPVTANEPTSLLQRCAESLEYPQLLDQAAGASSPAERLLLVAAFAISGLANNRVKERAIRKPFNPMLGETYELVREDLGFRFLAEKVSHHPVRMACQAQSLTNGGWTFMQSPQPVQKFWGKSVELNTEGRARVFLHAPKDGHDERYSWSQATCFLRNVIAGEKYVEPVQNMTVTCESTGMRAVVTFKAGGMFSGRSEEVTVELFDPSSSGDAPLSLGLAGKWTESLKRIDSGATIWKVGSLVPDHAKVYGFTTFAATLNEVTPIEDKVAPTDSRLRPDQRALELGDTDKAEGLKAKLEERQRARRKVLETHGQDWKPQFFEQVSGVGGANEEVWKLKDKGGYWDRRQNGGWEGVNEVFEI
ncbi:hypothetical protein K431DRAFT_287368 [Polychaeton citri CBS 116435]|uniref:PH domain-containing protein n=1 Tax=Polychaeton citri CBS 116435 TaxID=1314669 RepID=A0A9P4Q5K8_9PEZI|nr:hypothetical protein K431DRAFT_287368 [Polychaeton citri CBS 116435]